MSDERHIAEVLWNASYDMDMIGIDEEREIEKLTRVLGNADPMLVWILERVANTLE